VEATVKGTAEATKRVAQMESAVAAIEKALDAVKPHAALADVQKTLTEDLAKAGKMVDDAKAKLAAARKAELDTGQSHPGGSPTSGETKGARRRTAARFRLPSCRQRDQRYAGHDPAVSPACLVRFCEYIVSETPMGASVRPLALRMYESQRKIFEIWVVHGHCIVACGFACVGAAQEIHQRHLA